MSQPPLSQAILQLERDLGTRLLERTNRTVALTAAGVAFADECRALVAASQRARDVATDAAAGLTGTLRIGAVTSAIADPLPAILDRFRTTRPGVRLMVDEIDTHQGRDALERREIDVAIIRHATPGRGLTARHLRRDHFVVALPAQHPAAADGPIDLAGLADEPWVWLQRDVSPDYHDELAVACRRSGFVPRAEHHAASIVTQIAMVAAGLGITLVPNTSARPEPGRISYRPLADRVDLVELSLVHRDTAHEPLVEHFVTCSGAGTARAV